MWNIGPRSQLAFRATMLVTTGVIATGTVPRQVWTATLAVTGVLLVALR